MEKNELDYSDPAVLAKIDTAIEIMAARIGISTQRILAEESKPLAEQDPKLIARLNKEIAILYKERDRMYAGDPAIQEKIYQEYAPEVRDYFTAGKKNVR